MNLRMIRPLGLLGILVEGVNVASSAYDETNATIEILVKKSNFPKQSIKKKIKKNHN